MNINQRFWIATLISEYVAHFHGERNQQGLGNRLVEPLVANTNSGNAAVSGWGAS